MWTHPREHLRFSDSDDDRKSDTTSSTSSDSSSDSSDSTEEDIVSKIADRLTIMKNHRHTQENPLGPARLQDMLRSDNPDSEVIALLNEITAGYKERTIPTLILASIIAAGESPVDRTQSISALLDAGANPAMESSSAVIGGTFLHRMLTSYQPDVCVAAMLRRMLNEYPIFLGMVDSLLYQACSTFVDRRLCVAVLLDAGADVRLDAEPGRRNSPGEETATLLAHVLKSGQRDEHLAPVITAILEKGPELISRKDRHGCLPIHVCSVTHNFDRRRCLGILLNAGAKVGTKQENDGMNCLHLALCRTLELEPNIGPPQADTYRQIVRSLHPAKLSKYHRVECLRNLTPLDYVLQPWLNHVWSPGVPGVAQSFLDSHLQPHMAALYVILTHILTVLRRHRIHQTPNQPNVQGGQRDGDASNWGRGVASNARGQRGRFPRLVWLKRRREASRGRW